LGETNYTVKRKVTGRRQKTLPARKSRWVIKLKREGRKSRRYAGEFPKNKRNCQDKKTKSSSSRDRTARGGGYKNEAKGGFGGIGS